MTPDQARNLQPGDKIIIADMAATVYRVVLKYVDVKMPLRVVRVQLENLSNGPEFWSVTVMDPDGREGFIGRELIENFEVMNRVEPSWYADLMGNDGPRD